MDKKLSHDFLCKSEYEKLKDEQIRRIVARDYMIYLTLGAIGSVFAFGFLNQELNIAFLLLPYFLVIMGWNYYNNDRKISLISKYIENVITINNPNCKSSWESFRKKNKGRIFRKYYQLTINILLFIFTSIVSVVVFTKFNNEIGYLHYLLIFIVGILGFILLTLFVSSSHD